MDKAGGKCQSHRRQRNGHTTIFQFEGKHNLQTKAMIALFGLFAEIERDLIAERTKEGLAATKARGKQLGRPKGARGKSKLDGKEGEIRSLLQKQVSKASIDRIMDVSQTTLHHFIKSAVS